MGHNDGLNFNIQPLTFAIFWPDSEREIYSKCLASEGGADYFPTLCFK